MKHCKRTPLHEVSYIGIYSKTVYMHKQSLAILQMIKVSSSGSRHVIKPPCYNKSFVNIIRTVTQLQTISGWEKQHLFSISTLTWCCWCPLNAPLFITYLDSLRNYKPRDTEHIPVSGTLRSTGNSRVLRENRQQSNYWYPKTISILCDSIGFWN